MSKLSKWLKGAERAVSKVIPHQHSAERRAANQAVSEQIGFYQQQKADMEQEKTRVEGERSAEKKKINQKQIKNMRRSYRAPGFLDEASDSMSESLG